MSDTIAVSDTANEKKAPNRQDILLPAYVAARLAIPNALLTLTILFIGALVSVLVGTDSYQHLSSLIVLTIVLCIANTMIIIFSYFMTSWHMMRMIKRQETRRIKKQTGYLLTTIYLLSLASMCLTVYIILEPHLF